jgi:hypothetical protein
LGGGLEFSQVRFKDSGASSVVSPYFFNGIIPFADLVDGRQAEREKKKPRCRQRGQGFEE